jgi:CBS domain-containing protein
VCSLKKTVQVDCDALQAFFQMSKTKPSRLLMLNGDRLVGMIVLKDLLRYLAFRLDLEEMRNAT